MISRMYVEKAIEDHPRVDRIRDRVPDAATFTVDRYQDVFNRKAQDFRLQKNDPALILARKHDNYVLDTPSYCEIGDRHRFFYFSHMMNCVYDCRYCFLQGLYDSAHYVVFVNFEDFFRSIEEAVAGGDRDAYFFSGHVNDSLALDRITGFSGDLLPFFRDLEQAWVELRTKSVQIHSLLEREPFERCVVAWSMTPPSISRELEHDTPSVERRIEALVELQEQGWNTGLRFDPVIYTEDFRERYASFFAAVFERVDADRLHSVTLGSFRLPEQMFKNMRSLYPEEELFATKLETSDGLVSYRDELEREMLSFCADRIRERVPDDRFFPAVEPVPSR